MTLRASSGEFGNDRGIEFVGFMLTRGNEVVEVVSKEGSVLMLGSVFVSRKRTVVVSPGRRPLTDNGRRP